MNPKVSILSERTQQAARPTIAGRIRPGIKRLTPEAANHPQAPHIAQQMRAQGAKSAAIEKAIGERCNIDYPFYPDNTPWFNVTPSDFSPPELAQMILQRYGEQRAGDEQLRLYRFPMVFGTESLDAVLPHQFRQGVGEEGFESRYVNGQRLCFWLVPVAASTVQEQRKKRIRRVPPREKEVRGPCQPGLCEAYGSERCKFNATLYFYMPDIPSGLPLAMDTSSAYAAEGVWRALDGLVQQLGHIPRCHPETGKPLYWLEKRLEKRSFFNAEGQRQSRESWVPFLLVDVDMARLLGRSHPVLGRYDPGLDQFVAPPLASTTPAQTQAPTHDLATSAETDTLRTLPAACQPQLVTLAAALGLEPDFLAGYVAHKLGDALQDQARLAHELQRLSDLADLPDGCGAMLIRIGLQLLEHNLSQEVFRAYGKQHFGNGFSRRIAALEQIHATLMTQPQALLAAQNQAE